MHVDLRLPVAHLCSSILTAQICDMKPTCKIKEVIKNSSKAQHFRAVTEFPHLI